MKFAPVLLFLMLIFSLIWQSFVNQVWLEMAIQGLCWRGTLAPINLRDSKRNCVLNMRRLEARIVRREMESPEILRCHTQQAHEDYPSQPSGISHFSQIILAYELRTADLQDLDLSISWAPLELSRVMGTQSGSGIQRKNIGTALAWPGDVRTWGLSPYIKCGLLTTLSHCATPGHSGVIITEAIVSWVSSSPCRMDRPWPGSTQQGHTSHIAAMTWTGGRNADSSGSGDLNENSRIPSNLLLESKYFWYISMFWAD